MCGIAGILPFDNKPIAKNELEIILNKIAHRGRDHCGMTFLPNVALGHRRLSIIDLDDSAAQPMFYAQKRFCLTYNGELYNYLELKTFLRAHNYEFRTQSDTEVLLAAYDYWGKDCVQHFNGMFAFAIWDDKEKVLFCARDPVGIKPFYYKKTQDSFTFASESLALAHLSDYQLNDNAILSYCLSMYVATPESMFANIFKLAPGHYLTVNLNGQMHCARYWFLNEIDTLDANPDHLEVIKNSIKQALSYQVRSDVPVGGFLSGGIDSGIITALAAPQVQHYHTYSVGYEGMTDNELSLANDLAHRYQTKHTQITITASAAMDNLNKALDKISEPIADPAMVATYMLSELAAKDGVKVLLNGTGGDEVFAGYTRYTGNLSARRKLLLRLPATVKRLLTLFPLSTKLKTRLQHVNLDMLYSTGGSFTLANSISTNFHDFLQKLSAEFNVPAVHHLNSLYQRMFFDMHVYLPDQLLFLLDQMTMAHTIEGRVPLLDVQVIHQALKLKAQEHVRDQQTKVILKKLALPYLGKTHVARKKQGFAGSSSWWVKQNKDEFLSMLDTVKQTSYFSSLDVNSYKNAKTLSDNLTNNMFILYCFGRWHQKLKHKEASS